MSTLCFTFQTEIGVSDSGLAQVGQPSDHLSMVDKFVTSVIEGGESNLATERSRAILVCYLTRGIFCLMSLFSLSCLAYDLPEWISR